MDVPTPGRSRCPRSPRDLPRTYMESRSFGNPADRKKGDLHSRLLITSQPQFRSDFFPSQNFCCPSLRTQALNLRLDSSLLKLMYAHRYEEPRQKIPKPPQSFLKHVLETLKTSRPDYFRTELRVSPLNSSSPKNTKVEVNLSIAFAIMEANIPLM